MDLDPSQYGEADRREVDRRFKWRSPHGLRLASLIGGLKSGRSGSGGYAVQMAGNGGFGLLIFVPISPPVSRTPRTNH
jgi:hypothetical protein